MSKLIFIDSDETLRRSDGSISKNTKKIIKKVRELGNYVVICTGRPRYHTLEIMKQSGATPIVVSSNGSEIYDSENDILINSIYLDNKECINLFELCNKESIRIVFTIGNHEYATKYTKNNNQILLTEENYKEILNCKNIKQCLIMSNDINSMEEIKHLYSNNSKLKILNGTKNLSGDYNNWFSIGNSLSSKGYALKILANYLNISMEDTIAIGNDYNDISMLDEAREAICVDNAYEDIKKHATYITKSNDEDGVAYFLEKRLIKK